MYKCLQPFCVPAFHQLGKPNKATKPSNIIEPFARANHINKHKIRIPIKEGYIFKIDNKEVKDHIRNNISDYYYNLSVNKHIYIDGKFVMGIECKAYKENAMIKQILTDCSLLNSVYPAISCYLFQLESQLGGDYSTLSNIVYGSCPTHTIMSYFDVTLTIVTLLQGERNLDKPIHKYFKPLVREQLVQAKDLLKQDMQRYI